MNPSTSLQHGRPWPTRPRSNKRGPVTAFHRRTPPAPPRSSALEETELRQSVLTGGRDGRGGRSAAIGVALARLGPR
jgi:hypothetical protein